MLNNLKKKELKSVHSLVIIMATFSVALPIFEGDLILSDRFHHGEFFAGAVALFSDIGSSFIPLTIHGALDYIPALIAEYYWGANNYFLPTLAIYKALSLFSAILYILIAYDLTKNKDFQWVMILAAAVAAPYLVNYRDLFLLISIYLFIRLVFSAAKRDPSIPLQIIFGAMVAFGMFWSYDRGIAGALSLGAGIMFLLFRNSLYAISLASFLAAAGWLILGFEVFSIKHYFDNISILMQTSSQWSYGWTKGTVMLTVFSVALNIVSILLLIGQSFAPESTAEIKSSIISLGLLSIFMLKIGVNRADILHIYFACWVPILILFFLDKRKNIVIAVSIIIIAASAVIIAILYKSLALIIVAAVLIFKHSRSEKEFFSKYVEWGFGLLIATSLVFVLYSGAKSLIGGQYIWIKSLASPASNRLTVPDEVVWVSEQLKKRDVDCVFDLSNNGLINGLTRLPSCSRFTYPVYAGRQHESIIISDLLKSSPSAIIYSSDYWSYSIDGRDMKKRFPLLDEFIINNYPIEEYGHGYCVRYKVP